MSEFVDQLDNVGNLIEKLGKELFLLRKRLEEIIFKKLIYWRQNKFEV